MFTFSSAGGESFFGRTQLNSPDLPGPFDAPPVSNGTLKLRLQTFNPFGFAAGNRFLADEIRTIQTFAPAPDETLTFDTRARFVDDDTNPLSSGLVGGIFLFGLDAGFPMINVRDEIDFELLSNLPQGLITTNIFDDEGFNSAGRFEPALLPGLNLTEFNDFRIEHSNTATRFFVNDVLIRQDTVGLAVEPQDFRLNINAPDSSFFFAFSELLQPTAIASENETFIFEIDSLRISSNAAVPEPSTGLMLLALGTACLTKRRRQVTGNN